VRTFPGVNGRTWLNSGLRTIQKFHQIFRCDSKPGSSSRLLLAIGTVDVAIVGVVVSVRGPPEQPRRLDDIESPVRRTGAFGGLLGLLIMSPPLPASMARCEAPARKVTLRVGS
jgi:hypothetical protein